MTSSRLEQLSDEYETAEAAFLRAVRDGVARAVLAELVRTVAESAKAYNAEAHRAFFAGESAWMPLDDLTERTEVLSELWSDIAAAYAS